MLSSEHQCLVLSVGEIKENKGFKTSYVRVKTKEKRDESGELIREAGLFDCEVAVKSEEKFKLLVNAKGTEEYLPCFFILRSFFYKEKGVEKLGKQLQLKRWWR